MINRRAWIIYLSIDLEQVFMAAVAICNDTQILLNVRRKSWNAVRKVIFLVNLATKSACLLAVVNNSPFDHMIVTIVDCVEDETGIGQGCEENEKQQGEVHCDIEMCFDVFG